MTGHLNPVGLSQISVPQNLRTCHAIGGMFRNEKKALWLQ